MSRGIRSSRRGILALSGFLAIGCLSGEAHALPADGGPKYLVLAQIQLDDGSYFVPAGAGALLISPNGTGNKSNVIAYAREVRTTSFDSYAESLVDSWLDLEGHVHSRAVLERQADYVNFRERFYFERRGKENDADDPHLPLVRVSGAMDLDTLLIPFYRGRAALALARESWERSCSAAARDGGEGWGTALAEARGRLEESRQAAERLPRRRGQPIADDWTAYDPPDPLWGIENVRLPRLRWAQADADPPPNGAPPQALRLGFGAKWLLFRGVDESVDLAAAGPGELRRLAAAEAAAGTAVRAVVALCPTGTEVGVPR